MSEIKNEPAMCAGPHLDVRPPKLKLPPKSADCHCHVFGPRAQYPWAANRLYTPPPVLLHDYLAMLRATGFERGVMVQTGLYGPDNRFIVDAVRAHPKQLRAIALIGEDISDRRDGAKLFRMRLDGVDDEAVVGARSEEHTSELQSPRYLV